MSRLWITVGTVLGVAGVGGAALLYSRRASAASLPAPTPAPGQKPPSLPPIDLAPLPRASDVTGDLTTNWGDTPADLRPLFMLMEEVSKIQGSARVFAVIAYRESRFVTTAHNGNAAKPSRTSATARGSLQEQQGPQPAAQVRRAGGGVRERRPLRSAGAVLPVDRGAGGRQEGAPAQRAARAGVPAAGGGLRRVRLHAAPPRHYRIDDLADIKVGWANPSLLKDGRGGTKYHDVRANFLGDAMTLGIDLTDATTIPPKLNAAAWPGVPAVFKALVGALPQEIA
jgi:hypothetical protein